MHTQTQTGTQTHTHRCTHRQRHTHRDTHTDTHFATTMASVPGSGCQQLPFFFLQQYALISLWYLLYQEQVVDNFCLLHGIYDQICPAQHSVRYGHWKQHKPQHKSSFHWLNIGGSNIVMWRVSMHVYKHIYVDMMPMHMGLCVCVAGSNVIMQGGAAKATLLFIRLVFLVGAISIGQFLTASPSFPSEVTGQVNCVEFFGSRDLHRTKMKVCLGHHQARTADLQLYFGWVAQASFGSPVSL